MTGRREAALDLVSCEAEPIHVPGGIQAGCSLLLFDDRTGALLSASDNLETLFGAPLADLAGSGPERFFSEEDAAALRLSLSGGERLTSRHMRLAGGEEHWVRLFRTDGMVGVELNTFEDTVEDDCTFGVCVGDALGEAAQIADGVDDLGGDGIVAFAQVVADRFRALSGYDRTMVYRFDSDWNGNVIAESRAGHVPDSFLGLTFPSSDIPRQARRLFLRNRVRPVVDVASASVPLVPAVHPVTKAPFDLSDCSVRGVSPVHREYLGNMGVRATLTLALVVRKRLWGLLACHHYSAPYRLTPGRSSACQIFCEVVSSELTRVVDRTERNAIDAVRQRLRDFRATVINLGASQTLIDFMDGKGEMLLGMLNCDGMSVRLGAQVFDFGRLPPLDLLVEIRRRATEHAEGSESDVFGTHFAAGLWPDLGERLSDRAAGILHHAAPAGAVEIVAVRGGQEAKLTWGGDPYKRVLPETEGQRLHPRGSFEAWTETVTNRARPWSRRDEATIREMAIGLGEIDWLFDWRKSEVELAAARARTEHAALHDPLTDLPNRRYLTQVLEGRSPGGASISALMHLDLDRFKEVNDGKGHAAGDAVLVEVADRIRAHIREDDFCARIGGDEFVVTIGGETRQDRLQALGERLVEALSRPIRVEETEVQIGASVGIAQIGGDKADGTLLLHRADLALYAAKRGGRGQVQFYSAELEERQRRAKKLGEEILEGIRDGQFVPWYQPQVDARTGALTGVEALLRWEHPVHGTLTPDRFLPLAEQIDHIATLDAISMERAVADWRLWSAAGLEVPKLSLNLSARRLADPELLPSIRRAELPAAVFAFELLESIYLDEVDRAMEWNLDGLRELGIPIEVDDFGTGRTSIVSLVRLRPNRLKIDRQLVDPVVSSESARRLIASLVEIGQSLDIGVTAEGVETPEHARVLRDLGCSVLQGFAFARPMRAADLAQWIRAREAAVA